MHHNHVLPVAPAQTCLLKQGGAQIDEVDGREVVNPVTEEFHIAPRTRAKLDHSSADRGSKRFDQVAPSMQQPFAEAVVMFCLRPVKSLKALALSTRAAGTAQHLPNYSKVGKRFRFHAAMSAI